MKDFNNGLLQKPNGDLHQPAIQFSSLCTLIKKTKQKKKLCFCKVHCDNMIRLRLCSYPRCRTSKKRRKLHFCATNEMQEKAGIKADEAHFTYFTLHKRFTLTNAEVDWWHPITIRLPTVGSLSGCCIFPSQMLRRPISTAWRITKCQPFPYTPTSSNRLRI